MYKNHKSIAHFDVPNIVVDIIFIQNSIEKRSSWVFFFRFGI